ncbi:MAG: hypothetical protein QF632_01180 [Candidatus Woesearchaeota archaeon]|jgi:hypothetical protein|nr:hypothetical protein [Candidatus Woesearchaeota archaeon]
MSKPVTVAFISQKLKDEFESLHKGKFQDRQLYQFIDHALDDVKNHPSQMGGMKGKTTPSFETKCVVLEHAQDTTHTISGLA